MARHTGPQDSKCSSFSQRKDDRFSAKELRGKSNPGSSNHVYFLTVCPKSEKCRPGSHPAVNFMSHLQAQTRLVLWLGFRPYHGSDQARTSAELVAHVSNE
jgi:hypothetical protein